MTIQQQQIKIQTIVYTKNSAITFNLTLCRRLQEGGLHCTTLMIAYDIKFTLE